MWLTHAFIVNLGHMGVVIGCIMSPSSPFRHREGFIGCSGVELTNTVLYVSIVIIGWEKFWVSGDADGIGNYQFREQCRRIHARTGLSASGRALIRSVGRGWQKLDPRGREIGLAGVGTGIPPARRGSHVSRDTRQFGTSSPGRKWFRVGGFPFALSSPGLQIATK